jgi:hypothetical protein
VNRVLASGAAVFALLMLGCSGERTDETRTPTSAKSTAPSARLTGRECVRESAGPWTSKCSARWVRRIVTHSGYRVTGSTGSAWVAAGRGREFFIWATEASGAVEPLAKREGYRLVGRFAEVPVYDDGVRKFWPARGFLFWVAAGPRGDSVAPTADELAPIILATRTVAPPEQASVTR